MIPASFLLALFTGLPLKELYAAFPAKLVLLVLGVMYLWNHVQESGFAGIIVKRPWPGQGPGLPPALDHPCAGGPHLRRGRPAGRGLRHHRTGGPGDRQT